ncbi:choice-of-anchor D domain-containing protein [Bernardetia sp. ABR2-2B]|uniref:choice-of-anchor D domain-containing protein n=1 Tax=Bernardetia sp. ABR2-2B TaxID=3127472 RepID=UPI0030CD5CB3
MKKFDTQKKTYYKILLLGIFLSCLSITSIFAQAPTGNRGVYFDDNAQITSALPTTNTDDITVSFWIKKQANQVGTVIYNGTQGTNGYGVNLDATGRVIVELGGVILLVSDITLITNEWTYISVIRNSSTWSIYKNAIIASFTSGVVTSSPQTPTNNFQFGKTAITSSFIGQLDEVKIFNSVRSAANLTTDMSSTTLDGAVAFWRFEEANGTTVNDVSTNFNGTFATAPNTPLRALRVKNTNDSGTESLREVIATAETDADKNYIDFSIPNAPPHTINLASNIPNITTSLLIDGSSQEGFAVYSSTGMINVRGTTGVDWGFRFFGGTNTDSEVYGLWITNFDGYGIFQSNATNIKIGAENKGNVIGNISGRGIYILGGNSIIVQGNRIGTNPEGTAIAANSDWGIDVQTNPVSVLIGGQRGTTIGNQGEGNLISGNTAGGIILNGNGHNVQGNLIGTNISQDAAIPNGSTGITVQCTSCTAAAPINQIGGSISDRRGNIIGYNEIGIRVGGPNVRVEGNLIGINQNDVTIPNTDEGIAIDNYFSTVVPANIVIGNTSPDLRNVISGNSFGINISAAEGTQVIGNYIGTTSTGMAAHPNGKGISMQRANNTIGGATAAHGNLISGNTQIGIELFSNATGITVQNNRIGVKSDGTALGNGSEGISCSSGSNSIISNTIAYNANIGVQIFTSTSILVSENEIYCNGNTAITLGGGGNTEKQAPIITGVTTSAISGTCATCADGEVIEVFTDNTACTNTGGRNYLGNTTVTGNNWSFAGTFSTASTFSATATDAANNTSPFGFFQSPEIDIQGNGNSITDGSTGVSTTDDTDFGDVTTNKTVTYTIRNIGIEPLTVSTIGITGANAGNFAVSNIALPATVPANGNITFDVTFTLSLGVNNAIVTVNSNDDDEAAYNFAIRATGVIPPNFFVKTTGNDTNTGADFANAFATLEKALSVALAGSKIYVATGTYKPTQEFDFDASGGTNPREVTFQIPDNVEVYGGFTGNETGAITQAVLDARNFTTNETTLSGDIDNNDAFSGTFPSFTYGNYAGNSYHVVYTKNVSSATKLDGFTIKAGNADAPTTSDNNATGAGWFNDGRGTGNSSNPTITNCSFLQNTAREVGGAIYNFASPLGNASPNITNCSFSQNSAGAAGAAMYNGGNEGTSSPSIVNCIFFQNRSDIHGGAIFNDGNAGGTSSPSIINCSFSQNRAIIGIGGAIYNFGTAGTSSPSIINCSFSLNIAGNLGGAMYNKADNGGTSNTVIRNSIFWENSDNNGISSWFNESALPNVDYSLIEEAESNLSAGTVSGINNVFTQNPLFVNTATGDLSLQANSLAANTGDNTAINATGITVDVAGNPRIFNTNVDKGAYELQSASSAPPEINVRGGASLISILDGDTTPNTADDTDFGTVGSTKTVTYTIQNQGGSDLTISSINITGTDATQFGVSSFTNGTIIPINGNTTFDVTYTPNSPALQTATIIVNSDDPNEAAYDFAVSGTSGLVAFPYVESFTTGTIPSKWSDVAVAGNDFWRFSGNADYAAELIGDHTVGGGTNYAWVDGSTPNGAGFVNTLYTPFVDISGATDPEISFWIYSHSTDPITDYNTILVEFYDGAAWNTVLNNRGSLGDMWNRIEVNLASYTITGSVQLRFTLTQNGNQAFYNDILIDDVAFAEKVIEIDVVGNNTSISDGSTTPSVTNDTDFGNVPNGSKTVTYTIQSIGSKDLSISSINITGTNATDFVVNNFTPPTVINPSNSATFDVTFTPSSEGTKTATITINNDDTDESAYDFAITGEKDCNGTNTISSQAGTETLTSDASQTTPFYTFYEDSRKQFLIRASELTSIAGSYSLTRLAFDVSNAQSQTMNNFNVKIKTTTANEFTSATFDGGFTTVYSGTHVATNGLNWFNFITPFAWNGTDNLIVEVCFDNTSFTSSSEVRYSTTPFTSVVYDYDDGATGCNLTNTNVGSGSNRPNIVFELEAPLPEIDLLGNATSITDGDTTPNVTDNTDFGSVATSRTINYTIQNTAASSILTIADISVSGTNSGDFVVSNFTNNTTVLGSNNTTFDITFTPSGTGTRTATITVNNDDCDEAAYDFVVQGTSSTTPLTITATTTSINCVGTNGAIDVTITGGTPPYNFSWSNGETTEDISASEVGEYTVNVTDGTTTTYTRTFLIGNIVDWENMSNISITGNVVTKDNTIGWTSGANSASTQRIARNNDGWISNTITATTSFYMVGLAKPNAITSYTSIDYAWYFVGNGRAIPSYNKQRGTVVEYQIGDIFTVAREGNQIKFYKNGVVTHQYTINSNEVLIADVAIYSGSTGELQTSFCGANGGTQIYTAATTGIECNNDGTTGSIDIEATGATYLWSTGATSQDISGLDAGTYQLELTKDGILYTSSYLIGAPLMWTNLTNLALNGDGQLDHTSSTGWNTNANSTQKVRGDGGIVFKVDNTTTASMIGLSKTEEGAGFMSIDYAIYTAANGKLYVFENGANRGDFGTYQIGDGFKIERVGTQIYYSKNGTIFYTSTSTAPTDDLEVDVSLSTANATLPEVLFINCAVNLAISAPLLNCGVSTGSATATLTGGTFTTSYVWKNGAGTTVSTTNTLSNQPIGYYTVTASGAFGSFTKSVLLSYPIDFVVEANTIISGTTVSKSIATSTWDAGVHTTNLLNANQDGFVENTILENTSYMFGLTLQNTNPSFTSIKYRWYVLLNGRAIAGGGVVIDYNEGDKLRVERVGSVVKYFHNKIEISQQSIDPSEELIADVAIYTPNGNAGSYKISFCNSGIIGTPPLNKIQTASSLEVDTFKIYPNPSTGIFKVHFGTSISENIQVTIFDGIGRKVSTHTFEKGKQDFNVNLKNQSKGMYLIHFNQNGATYSKQLILE